MEEQDHKNSIDVGPDKPVTSEEFNGTQDDKESDLPKMSTHYGCESGGDLFKRGWDKISQGNSKRPTRIQLFFLICRIIGWKLWFKVVMSVVLGVGLNWFHSFYILPRFIGFLRGTGEWEGAGWLYAVGLVLTLFLQSTGFHNHFMYATMTGAVARGSLLHAVYLKATRLSVVSNTGNIVNMQAADTSRVLEFFRYIHILYMAPLYAIVCTIFICIEIGPGPGFAAMGLLFLLIPLQMILGAKTTSIRKETAPITDKRVSLMHEILEYIRLVKFYNWESSFSSTTTGIRKNEVKGLRDSLFVKGLNYALTQWITPLAIFTAFSIYTSLGNTIDPAVAFTVMLVINVVKVLTSIMPHSIKFTAELMITLTRFIDYFSLPERMDQRDYENKSKEKEIQLVRVTFKYEANEKKKDEKERHNVEEMEENSHSSFEVPSSSPFQLSDLNFHVVKGELVAVVGSVGSGKTTLLQGILGEVPFLPGGQLHIRGSLCYVPQQPWLLNESLRTNILFNNKFKEKRYIRTLEACQLLHDIETLPAGEMTEIGEKGVNLSGGQKQRVSLARAVYANRDIYLMDDTLSAVDPYVGNAIFNEVIKGILKDKTIIFVTNQLQYVSRCDKIIYLVDGKVKEHGTFQELMEHQGEFASRMKDHAAEGMKAKKSTVKRKLDKPIEEILRGSSQNGALMKSEERSEGSLSGYVLKEYLKEGGILILILSMLLFIASQAAMVFFDYYFSYFMEQTNSSENARPYSYFISIWWCILGALAIGLVLRYLIFAIFSLNAATRIHNKVFKKVLRGPMSFFDATPIGRIINRFSRDQDNIDDLLYDAAHLTVNAILIMVSTFALISSILWYFAIALLPIAVLFWFIASFYRKSSRELKRLEGITRSPILSHLSATLQGLTSIKAYGAMDDFVSTDIQRVDVNTNVLMLWDIASRWLAIRLDFVAALLVLATSIVALVMRDRVDVSLLSLCIVYSLQMTYQLQTGLQSFTATESLLTSVERLLEYSHGLEQEAPAIISDNRPSQDWPESPSIQFKNVEIRYNADGEPALKKVSFKVKPYYKIGIVGRTGSGKSTLASSLFRIVELTSGKIFIDGTDISKIGLNDLRSKIAIVPQDPVLFKATMRYNLDPFGVYGDEEIWEALEKVNMKQTIMKFNQGLELVVEESGSNFSAGQRQLLCIARAILRKSNILVLDEATASIDMETDEFIQKTIRNSFSQCTVLTIAHRLHTIIDGDKILMLEKGEVKEYDSPKNLLKDENSEFSKLVNETGKEMSKTLRKIARGERKLYEEEKKERRRGEEEKKII